MTNLDQNLDEIFDGLMNGGIYTPEEMIEDYDNYDLLAVEFEQMYGEFADMADDLPIEFESWADVAEALLEWAKERFAN